MNVGWIKMSQTNWDRKVICHIGNDLILDIHKTMKTGEIIIRGKKSYAFSLSPKELKDIYEFIGEKLGK